MSLTKEGPFAKAAPQRSHFPAKKVENSTSSEKEELFYLHSGAVSPTKKVENGPFRSTVEPVKTVPPFPKRYYFGSTEELFDEYGASEKPE